MFIGGIFLHDESLSLMSVIQVVISFGGVLAIIIGAVPQSVSLTNTPVNSADVHVEEKISNWNYGLLALVPVVIALGNMAMSNLK